MGTCKEYESGSAGQAAGSFVVGGYNPGGFQLDTEKLKKLRPQMFGLGMFFGSSHDTTAHTSMQLMQGDTQPAVVVSTSPLLVACYSEDFDAVAMVCYPDELGRNRGWEVGTRLICVCMYQRLVVISRDLDKGPKCSGQYTGFGPMVADLYAKNTEYLAARKRQIPDSLWQMTRQLGEKYMADHPGMARNGLDYCFRSAKPIRSIRFNRRARLD